MEETNTKQRGKWKRPLQIVILIAAIIVCAVSIYNIIAITSEDQQSRESTEMMRTYVSSRTSAEPSSEAPQTDAEPAPTTPGQLPNEAMLDVDFEGLKAVNPEVIAWIDIPGTDISYPVVQNEDKNYYLNVSADGTPNRAGAIFVDYRNAGDFSETNTIVYGHRMNNGSMFGTLNEFADVDYAAAHPYIYIYLPDEDVPRAYEIFSTKETSAKLDSDPYQLDFADGDAVLEWIEVLRQSGNWRDGEEFEADDTILTLSTCVRGNAENRFVVQAKRVI